MLALSCKCLVGHQQTHAGHVQPHNQASADFFLTLTDVERELVASCRFSHVGPQAAVEEPDPVHEGPQQSSLVPAQWVRIYS